MGSASAPELWVRLKQFGDVGADWSMLISTALNPVMINRELVKGSAAHSSSQSELNAGSQRVRVESAQLHCGVVVTSASVLREPVAAAVCDSVRVLGELPPPRRDSNLRSCPVPPAVPPGRLVQHLQTRLAGPSW
jgi:hypothetical protein